MKHIIFFLALIITYGCASAQIYKSTSGKIAFFSETPVENINAINGQLKGLINTKNGEVAFVVTNVGFEFDKPLMGEHFNENYMESDKYKVSVFKGKINEQIDFLSDGTYNVTVKGTLDIHGVIKDRELPGKIVVKDKVINVISEFDVLLKDHKIKIPKVVNNNIAETVKVTVNITMEEKK